MAEMAKLRWGVIGIGNIVQSTIAPAMVAEADCELIAAVSRDQGRADEFAARFGARYAYTEYDEMLANPEVEAVFIATPNNQHAAQTIAAARAGKHVLCDKPMAITVADAVASVEACEEAGVKLGINFHNRHLPWVQDTKKMVADGEIGEVELIQVEGSSGPRQYDNWRTDPEMAGLGSLYNVGVHVLDFLGWILDAEAIEVTGFFDERPGSGQVERLATVLMRFSNGTVAYVNSNEKIHFPKNDIVIYGTKGRIAGSGLTRARIDGDLQVLTGDGETMTPYPSPQAHRRAVAAFTNAVLTDQDPNASGLDGLRSMQLCEAIARSVVERRTVDVGYGR
jgi:1,5-anhydro-D-fructose reductase (1,5-anhydro-D-mannitol-forming)